MMAIPRSRSTAIAMLACIATAACVNPSAKIATELIRYGFDSRQAQCVGDRLEANLSIGQLQQLARAARTYSANDATPGRLIVSDLMRVSAQIDDPRVPVEVGRAAAGCGVVSSVLGVGQ